MNQLVHGSADDDFDEVVGLLVENVENGSEAGVSLAVDVGGRLVLDLWGGYADAARTRPWKRDTVVNVWSSTKTVTSLAALILVDRGLLDVYAPVAQYWPEFAANGKGDIEVRHVLSHTSGLSGWDAPWNPPLDVYDFDKGVRQLARQRPWWKPGTASGYHAYTMGHLVGELVRRTTGVTLKEFVRDEIAAPLGADFQIGAAESDQARIAELIAPPPPDVDLGDADPDGPKVKTFASGIFDAAAAATPEWRAADLGAGNGHGNARSLARMLSPISLGGQVNGVRLLRPKTIELIFDEQAHGVDLVSGIPLRLGIGFGLPDGETTPYIPDARAAYWGGWGGSIVVAHPDRGVTIAYAMNKMGPGIIGSDRSLAYLTSIYSALDARPVPTHHPDAVRSAR